MEHGWTPVGTEPLMPATCSPGQEGPIEMPNCIPEGCRHVARTGSGVRNALRDAETGRGR